MPGDARCQEPGAGASSSSPGGATVRATASAGSDSTSSGTSAEERGVGRTLTSCGVGPVFGRRRDVLPAPWRADMPVSKASPRRREADRDPWRGSDRRGRRRRGRGCSRRSRGRRPPRGTLSSRLSFHLCRVVPGARPFVMMLMPTAILPGPLHDGSASGVFSIPMTTRRKSAVAEAIPVTAVGVLAKS